MPPSLVPVQVQASRRQEERGEYPCHGSIYNPMTGKAFAGPAALQGLPPNVLPILYLEDSEQQNLRILPPAWSVDANGIVGYGRLLKT
jgi:rieske iron-sulfur protein